MKGLKEAQNQIREMARVAHEECVKAANVEIVRAARESINECPVDTGFLRGSQQVTLAVRDKPASIAYNSDYAWFQHENLQFHHDVGKAKYLEDPMNRAIPRFLKRAGDNCVKAWKRIAGGKR